MKAYSIPKYGPPERLKLIDIPRPQPIGHEVLVKIHTTAINDYDWSMVRGRPFIYRFMFGLFKPNRSIPGMELAGTVVAVGDRCTTLQVGDHVYGDISDYGFGSFAEYICIHEQALVQKPSTLSFEEAASISHAFNLAVQGLRDKGQLQQGNKVLINGAGGGVGTFAFQIAKMYACEITGVDTGHKLHSLNKMGFDHVIDYKESNFTKLGNRYDLILDAKSSRSAWAYARALNPSGRYVTVGGRLTTLLMLLTWMPWFTLFSTKRFHIVSLKANKDLSWFHELWTAQKIFTVIDGPYTLQELPSAVRRFGEGKHHGKVVVVVNQ